MILRNKPTTEWTDQYIKFQKEKKNEQNIE